MKISTKTQWLLPVALLGVAALAGCSSSSSSNDSGTDAHSDSGTGTGTDASGLFGLTAGDNCFDILSVVGTPDDGCDFGVGDTAAMNGLVGTAIPFNYTLTANVATIAVGTDGILGGGPIANNVATLVHDADNTDAMMSTCTWHENASSMVTLTAQNAFTISVVRTQSMFADACSASTIPTGGMCTSTWMWTMKKSTTKTIATGCK